MQDFLLGTSRRQRDPTFAFSDGGLLTVTDLKPVAQALVARGHQLAQDTNRRDNRSSARWPTILAATELRQVAQRSIPNLQQAGVGWVRRRVTKVGW